MEINMAGEKRKPKKKTVKVGKSLDASMVDALKEKLAKFVKEGIIDLILDMKGVETVDSMGLGLIIASQNSMSAVDGKLLLKNVSKNLSQLFKVMHLDMTFEIREAD